MKSRLWLALSVLVGCSRGGAGPADDPSVDLALPGQMVDGSMGMPDLAPSPDLALPPAEGKPLWGRSYAAVDVRDVATSADGSIYLTGTFGRADFGDGTVSSNGSSDGFLIKFDKNGQRLWARTFGRSFADVPTKLAVDKSGNAASVGYSLRLDGTGTHDAFVAYYDSGGTQKYFRAYGGPLDTAVDTAMAVAFAADGSLYVSGGFEDRINFGGGDLISAGTRDIYLLQLSAAGSYVFAKRWGFTDYDQSSAMAVLPGGDVLLAGTAGYPIDFGDGNVGSDPSVDTFLVRFSPQGVARLSKRFKIHPSSVTFVAAAPDGSYWYAGDTNTTVDFGGGPRSSPTGRALFTAHYSSENAYLEAFLIPTQPTTYLTCIEIDASGQLILGGQVNGDVDFGLGTTMASAGNVFFLKRTGGVTRWVHRFGSGSFDKTQGVAINPSTLQVHAAGALSNTVTLGSVSLSPSAFLLTTTP